MFDLSVFDTETAANEGAKLHLLNPKTGLPAYADAKETKPVTITVVGTDGDVFTKEQQKQAKVLARKQKQKGDKAEDFDFDEEKKRTCDLYARMTKSWENITLPGDKGQSECTYENAYKLYMSFKDIRLQVSGFMADKANFIKG